MGCCSYNGVQKYKTGNRNIWSSFEREERERTSDYSKPFK